MTNKFFLKDQEKKNNNNDNLNLSDLNLKQLKLSEEDAIALSYLTPGLSRRIQKQLLAQLPPSEAKKLTRTMSMRSSKERAPIDLNLDKPRTIIENQTLPRRYSTENNTKYNLPNKLSEREKGKSTENSTYKSESVKDDRIKYNYRDLYSPVSDGSIRSDSLDLERIPNPRAMRSVSLREPRHNYSTARLDSYRSPDSSISDKNDDFSYKKDNTKGNIVYNQPDLSPISKSNNTYAGDSCSISRPSSYTPYNPETSALTKYLSPNKYSDGPRSTSPSTSELEKKTELKRPSSTTRKISRFLRPDFYDSPKEETAIVKEKKEREMETQKVLKEIRDKRKNRLHLRRERSTSRETSSKKSGDELDSVDSISTECDNSCTKITETTEKRKDDVVKPNSKAEDTNDILNNISDSIKTIETNIISPTSPEEKINKKDRISKLIRPKSYPADNLKKDVKESGEKDATKSKIAKFKKEPNSQNGKVDLEKSKSPPKATAEKSSNKNKFFQTIEKKFEKLRSFNNSPSRENSVDKKVKEEKKSTVENAIKRLREQSLPRNIDHCITESGLIKRAVSVEDVSTLNTSSKELQPSRKSVTKILGLFKKYEEKDKKNEKSSKLKKPKEISGKEKNDTSKSSQLKTKKADSNKIAEKSATNKASGKNSSVPKLKGNDSNVKELSPLATAEKDITKKIVDVEDEKERPKSLGCDFQKGDSPCKGTKSDTAICNDNKMKFSRLPVNSFRRSLNLDKTPASTDSLRYKTYNRNSLNDQESNVLNNNATDLNQFDMNDNDSFRRPDRRNLKLDLRKITDSVTEGASTGNSEPNRNSTTDDSSVFLSPCDDNMSCDSWSICSDYHTHDLLSPISPNGHIYSGDEGESVIDRIRRKSFYTRFNEKKRPRKTSLTGNYRDLDLYKDYSQRKGSGYRTPNDYGSLDRKSADYRAPSAERRLSYNADPVQRQYKPYVRSSSLLNDYVNVPNRFQTYNPRMARHISSLYSPENDDGIVDMDVPTAGKSRISSFHYQPSRINGRASSVSPSMDTLYSDPPRPYKHNSAANTSHTST